MKKALCLLAAVAFAVSCSAQEDEPPISPCPPPATVGIPQPTSTPQAPGTPSPGAPSFSAVAVPLMQQYCVSCHAGAGFTQTQAAFDSSQAKAYIQSKQMPLAGSPQASSITDAARQQLLQF